MRPLLLHPDESAGGLMTSEYLALRRRMTVAEAVQVVRAWQPDRGNIYSLFVVDGQDRLCSAINLRQLIVADPQEILADIMDPDVVSVKVGVDQEECAGLMSRYNLIALPVVNEDNRLLGVITVDDVLDVLVEEATEDIQKLGGAQPLDEPYLLTKASSVFRKRVGWLMLGAAMAVVAYIRALTVSLAILSIVVWANLLGAVLPTLAMRFKIDPTVVSGPVMSTLVDATGLFIYFSIAKMTLGI